MIFPMQTGVFIRFLNNSNEGGLMYEEKFFFTVRAVAWYFAWYHVWPVSEGMFGKVIYYLLFIVGIEHVLKRKYLRIL